MNLTLEETSVLMHDMPRVYGVQMNDILLTALVFGLSWRTGSRSLQIDLSAHGREPIFEDIDVSRTVGWFACGFPVTLDLHSTSHPMDAVHLVHKQLQVVPTGGIGHGVLRYMSSDRVARDRIRSLPQPVVGLNYQGRGDFVPSGSRLFSHRRKLSTQPPANPVLRSPRLPVSGHIYEGKLHLRIRYHERVYRRDTIERIGAEVMETLRAMVTACQEHVSGNTCDAGQ